MQVRLSREGKSVPEAGQRRKEGTLSMAAKNPGSKKLGNKRERKALNAVGYKTTGPKGKPKVTGYKTKAGAGNPVQTVKGTGPRQRGPQMQAERGKRWSYGTPKRVRRGEYL